MKMQSNKTLGPTTYPKRHPFLDIDNVVEWDLNAYQHFPKPERLETTGLECGPPGSWDARVAAGWGSVLYDEGRFRGWICCMPGIGSLPSITRTRFIKWARSTSRYSLLFTVGLPLRQIMGQNPNGHSHLRMAFSHDGIVWRHPRGRPVFIDGGAPGEFGAGFITSGSNILEHNDEQWLFCSGINRDHGWGIKPDFSIDDSIPPQDQERRVRIFVAKQKRDRFASVASNQTARFDVEIGPRQGNELTFNALTRHQGSVRVAIAEQRAPLHLELRKNESIRGFSFDDCAPFSGDAVKAPVRFRKAKIADLPRDRFLILRFEVNSGEIFGYEWM